MAEVSKIAETTDPYTQQTYKPQSTDKNTLSMENYFQLLSAELANQDMTNPMSTTDLMNEMSQMGMVQSMASMTEALKTVNTQTQQSYAASMTMAMTLGPFLASARERGRGAHAFGWLALYFLAFYASHYAVRILNPDMTVPLAAILLCLLGSVIAILLGDWSGLEVRPSTAGEPPTSGRRPPCADLEGLRAFGLTQREMDVLGGLLDGRTFKQIARENEVSVNTVRAQAQSLYRKLGVHSREELGERFGGADGGRDDEPA